MIIYQEYEKQVYNWLQNKHEKDNSFTFSVRKKGSKGVEYDYFIGREKSKYFGMTFWTIPSGGFPGSPGGCINLIFSYDNDKYQYKFEFTQSKEHKDSQNKSILDLLIKLKDSKLRELGFSYISPDSTKRIAYITKQGQNSYTSLDNMLADIDKDLNVIIPVVDKEISTIKVKNPTFKANRITSDEFKKMQENLEKRLANKDEYENISRKIKAKFTKWLNVNESSKKASSYIRALDILNEILDDDLYLKTNLSELNLLYKELIEEQRNSEGKYFYEDAPSYGNSGFYSASIKSFMNFLEKKDINQPDRSNFLTNNPNSTLNQILYGPPGTGKTYNTILRAAQIIENRVIDSYDEALDIFKTNLHNQIEFITFHQNYSYEDFIQGLRPETDNKSSLVFNKKDGVFKKIADKALENLKLAQKAPDELSSEAKFDKALELFSDKVLEIEDNFKINNTAYIFEVEEDAFRYTGEKWTNHTNGLRMKFSDLKEFYRNNVKSRKDIKSLSSISGLANQHATYYYLVYAEIIKYLPKKTVEPQKVIRKNFVIIIDEINRANISRVFGELIH